jgi:hypothetical protein
MEKNSPIKMILRKTFLIVVLFLSIAEIKANEKDSLNTVIENGWIEKMNSKMAVDISLNNLFNIFEVRTPENRIVLYPNAPNNLKLRVNYDFLALGFQFSPDFLPGNSDNDIKGNTKHFQMKASLVLKHWFTDLSYSKTRGFYLKNTSDYIPWEKGEPYIQFPDLHHKGFSMTLGYIHNPKFSLRSLTLQTERQLKSAGSFLPILNFDYYGIDDKSSGASTQKSNNIEANMGPGYVYTCVIKEKLYMSAGLFASLGYLHTKLTTRTENGNYITNQDNFIFRWDGRTGIGYNGEKYYTGLYVNVSGTEYKQQNTTATNFETRLFYHFFFGMRFKAPRFLEKQVSKIKNKVPVL